MGEFIIAVISPFCSGRAYRCVQVLVSILLIDKLFDIQVYILEETEDGPNLYVHHDIIISAFPLCTAWLDFPLKGGKRGLILKPLRYTVLGLNNLSGIFLFGYCLLVVVDRCELGVAFFSLPSISFRTFFFPKASFSEFYRLTVLCYV